MDNEKMKTLKSLFVTPEIAPWVKTGGLGDVAAALPEALRSAGVDVRILVPRYPALREAFPKAKLLTRITGLEGQFPDCALYSVVVPKKVTLWLLDAPELFDRPGNPYLNAAGQDWPDNALRFGLLSRVAAWIGSKHSTLSWHPHLVHSNDWQGALTPLYLQLFGGGSSKTARSLLTIHNLAFQGLFGQADLAPLGLPDSLWTLEGVEYHGYLSFLKAGLQFADRITTVSPTYAQEIQRDETGMGLAGLLRHRSDRLSGILNGIDTTIWNPETDPWLPAHYAEGQIKSKSLVKKALQDEMGLQGTNQMPLLGVVSRLTTQKGLDWLQVIAEELMQLPAQLVVLGSGAREMEADFLTLAARYPGQIAVRIGFDEGLAHRIEGGADMFLMPSRFEPCGLNQMISLRYGTPPVVRTTGGLADTVVDGVDGFCFSEETPEAFLSAIRRAVTAWHNAAAWKKIQRHGMTRHFGWEQAALQYAHLYAEL
ncbi:MAG: glycogen synthase GlgA [Rhodocyclaceae bacterium]|nr:glycogen synthase GlgA [Rhodocyclaceae bacterium]